jgi:hypothetical protein
MLQVHILQVGIAELKRAPELHSRLAAQKEKEEALLKAAGVKSHL